MCDNPKVALMLKSEYDEKFLLFGQRTPLKFVGRLSDYAKNVVNSNSLCTYDISSHFPKEYDVVFIPCRKCFSCRLDHSKRRAGQAYAEFKTSEKACFLTLTFGDQSTYDYYRNRKYGKMSRYMARRRADFLSWSLDSETFKGFMKRLRDHVRQVDMRRYCLTVPELHECIFKYDKFGRIDYNVPRARVKFFNHKEQIMKNCKFRKIRFLHTGEYGSKRGRAHHHCILYGIDFNDYSDVYTQEVYHAGKSQVNTYSRTLDKLWPFGQATIGKCTYNSINYVSRYCLKKVLGENKAEYYQGRKPEYITCSTKPALGHQYLIENFNDICANRHLLILDNKGNSYTVPISRYYSDYIKKVSVEHNNGVAYGSYSDIVYSRSVEDNLNKYNKILNAGFFNWSKRKQVDSENVVKQLVRSFDDTNVVDLSLIKRLKAFGISYEYYCQHKNAINFYFNVYGSYKLFERVSDFPYKQAYANFEKERYRLLEFLKNDYFMSLTSRVDFINITPDVYAKRRLDLLTMTNPFKKRRRSKYSYSIVYLVDYISNCCEWIESSYGDLLHVA